MGFLLSPTQKTIFHCLFFVKVKIEIRSTLMKEPVQRYAHVKIGKALQLFRWQFRLTNRWLTLH